MSGYFTVEILQRVGRGKAAGGKGGKGMPAVISALEVNGNPLPVGNGATPCAEIETETETPVPTERVAVVSDAMDNLDDKNSLVIHGITLNKHINDTIDTNVALGFSNTGYLENEPPFSTHL